MTSDAELLRRLSAFEDRLAVKIAERGMKTPDAEGKRILRSNWTLARARADMFMEMAMDIEADLTIKVSAHSND